MPRTETVRALEHEVGVLIRRVRRAIGERARAVHPDLQPMSYLILAHLAETGPMRSSALAETFGADKGAVSRQVQHLSNLGLLDKAPDPQDGRATLLSPSDDASRRLDEVRQQRRRRLDERLGDWSDEDLEALVTALGRYNRTLS
ncbi:MAG TPA: MarR family transcriptional regulator [Nocardioides sp.]|nr:MarR family transcriptional regulator [Nocardioides sp.]